MQRNRHSVGVGEHPPGTERGVNLLYIGLVLLLLAGCGKPAGTGPLPAKASEPGKDLAGRDKPAGTGLLPVKGGEPGKDLVVFVGDSLTAGDGVYSYDAYPGVAGDYWQRHGIALRARNAGVSGGSSTGVLMRLDGLLAEDVCLAFIEIGINDVFYGEETGAIHETMGEIIRRIQARDIQVVLAGMALSPERVGADRAAGFNRMYQELGREYGVPVMPFFKGVGPGMWLADGAHLNEKGHRAVARNVLAFLNPEWKLEP